MSDQDPTQKSPLFPQYKPEVEKQEPVIQSESDSYSDSNQVSKIASWADWLAWIVLMLPIIYLVLSVVALLPYIPQTDGFVLLLTNLGVPIFMVIVGCFLFVFLRAVREGLYILLDIEENTQKE